MFSLQSRRGSPRKATGCLPIRWWVLPLLTVGCQSYQAAPLDPTQHIQTWQAQSWQDLHDAYDEALAALQASPGETPSTPAQKSPLRKDAQGRYVLDLVSAQDLAAALDPELRVPRLRVLRAVVSMDHAGLREDLEVGLEWARNVDSGNDPWGLLFEGRIPIPLSDRLEALRDLRSAEAQVAWHELRLAEWESRLAVRELWLRWSHHRALAEGCERYLTGLQGLIAQSQRLVDAGEMDRTEANLFALEEVRWQTQAQRLLALAEADQAELRVRMGLPAHLDWLGQPVTLPVPPWPAWDPLALGQQHPELQKLQAQFEVSEQSLRTEIAKQLPDLGLGPLIENGDGDWALGLSAGWHWPLWNRNRRAIALARADREIARSAYESRYETLVGQAYAAQAQARAHAQAAADLESRLLPLLTDQVEQSQVRLQLGEAQTLILLEALRAVHAARQELSSAQYQHAQAQIQIERACGPRPANVPTPSAAE